MSVLAVWFKDAGHASLVAAVISIASLVLAAIALVKSSRAQNRALAIEETREADRKRRAQKAQLVARIAKDEGGSYWLEIANQGEAEARGVQFTLDGKGPDAHEGLEKRSDEREWRIGPHGTARFLLILTMMERPPYDVVVTWDDDSEEPGEFRTTLTF